MQPFSYVKANDPADASSQQIASGGGIFLGGGTCLIDLMKLDVMTPSQLIDVRKSSNQSTAVKDNGKTVVLSGSASNSAVAHDPLIQSEFPVISQAILSGASPQLRNAATIAGNLMQRTRCYYFRDPVMPCNKNKPGSGCPAIDGFNRMHAVLGTSDDCIAAHPSDMCVALAALDAVVRVHDGSKHREIPLIEFHTLPGKNPEIETVLKPHEVITAVEIAKSDLARHSHYHKVRDRASFSFALTSAAVALLTDGGKIKEARLALGGVGTKPWRCQRSESALQGKTAEAASYRAAAELALSDAVPRKHNRFKVELSRRTIVKAYEELQKA